MTQRINVTSSKIDVARRVRKCAPPPLRADEGGLTHWQSAIGTVLLLLVWAGAFVFAGVPVA